jgi:hypothetical protein
MRSGAAVSLAMVVLSVSFVASSDAQAQVRGGEAGAAALDEKHAADMIRKSPGIAGSKGREWVAVVKIEHIPEKAEEGWLVEFQWKEAGKMHTGVAPIVRTAGQETKPWYFQDHGFGIVAFVEDKTSEALKTEMKVARIKSFEAAALGDVRTVLSAEVAYSSANQGAYDSPACLIAPANCLPGYSGPPMLTSQAIQSEKYGYRRSFHAGPKARAKAKASPTSLTAFAFTAVPISPGESGVRGFCGDDTGRICVTADGSEPPVVSGRCATPCQELK